MDRQSEIMLRRSRLSEAGKALLAERLLPSLQEKSAPEALPKRRPHQKSVLSFAQQRLWFLDQLSPGKPFYNIPLLVDLDGIVSVSVLERCLQTLCERHEALRTNFVLNGDDPEQIITTTQRLFLPVVDLQQLSARQRLETAQWLAQKEARQPFDLTSDPLIRCVLLRLEPQKHQLLLTIHHIIADGWSLATLYRELVTIYEAFLRGRPSPLPPLPMQYVDYALWQRDWLQGEVLQKQLAYWRQQLADVTPLDLPTDYPRPPVQTLQSAELRFTLPLDLVSKINAFCKREGITSFIFMLAAFQTLLARYTGQNDIAVGTPISGRTKVELEGLVGFFVNTLAIRTSLSGNPRLREILLRVRDTVSAAFNNQDVPFERLVEELQPERNMSQTPLIQTLFTQKVPVDTHCRIDQLSLWSQELGNGASQFDLMLTMSEEQGTLEYSTDLFAASTMDWLVHVYETVLLAFVTTPDQSLSDLLLLGEARRRQILVEWNDTQTAVTLKTVCLHYAFEEQVARTPDAVALLCEEHFLTYGALNRRANQIAWHLQRRGIVPGARVGLFMERSLAAIIGIMGILKAGGAYVPLDPAYPQERLAFMLASADISMLLTNESVRSQLPPGKVQAICLDTDASVLMGERGENPPRSVSGEHLAYVIFTSGTTGQPKGAGVYHRGLMNLLQWYISDFNISERDRGIVVTSLSFDLTQKNLFAPLLVGGVVCLHASRYHDVPFLRHAIEAYTITLLNCTPSMFYPFVDEDDRLQQLRSLRYVFLGGEPIIVRRLQKWLEYPDCHAELVNTYGPTECSDVVAFYRLTHPLHFLEKAPPLGRPIANVQVLVLDTHLQPVPPLMPGEVYIAGTCVGAGYVNDEQLTREKFIPHPFPELPGTILYRTGDVARYLSDGQIEYLGRGDQQVKIRGFRIELGEIEAMLEQHTHVQACVAHIWTDEAGEKHLVAYIVGSQALATSELRAYLRVRLPGYMVPAFFIALDAFPLTPSGKIDRRSLPAPTRSEYELGGQRGEARTPIEEVVVHLYHEILNVEQVGLYDNFFDLGGHSLLATRVIARLRTLLQVEMPLRSLFEAPVVADFSRRIEQVMRNEQEGAYVALVPVDRSQTLPLSFAQQRIWFQSQLASEASTYALPLVLRLQGPLNTTALEKSLQEIVQRHEILRTTFTSYMGQPVQVIQKTLLTPFELLEVPHEVAHDAMSFVAPEVTQRIEQPFDLQSGPLLRAGVFRIQETEHIFFLVFHHSVFDGWSVGVLLRELAVLYEAFVQGNASPLPPLPIQYVDFACWQREWLQGAVLAKLTQYWKEQLRGATALTLAKDRPGMLDVTNRGAALAFTLSEKLSKDVIALSRREEVTLFTTLLAAFQLLLYRSTGQQDVVVGTDIANRTHEEIEKLIGFFVNVLPLRTQFRVQDTFRDVLKRVRTMVLNAYAHQDLPFEKIVDVLQLERSGKQTPLINVLFVWQNVPLPALHFGGLELSLLEEENEAHTAKFDLALFMIEKDGIITGLLNYRTDLFTREEIFNLRTHFTNLLQSIVAVPDVAVETLEMFTQEEKEQRLRSEARHQEGQRRMLKTVKRQALI